MKPFNAIYTFPATKLVIILVGLCGLISPLSVKGQDIAQLAMQARTNLYTWQFDSAAFYFDKVIGEKYAPAFAYADYGWYLIMLGKLKEGRQRIEQAAELSPADKQLATWSSWAILWQGDLPKAQQWIAKALDIDPDYGEALHVSSLIASDIEHHDEAIAFAKKAASNDSTWRASVPLALAKAGKSEEALLLVQKIARTENVYDAMILMEVYGYLKNKEKAMEYMQKSYDLKHPYMPWLQFVPGIKHLHADPRYISMIDKMNLPR